MHDEELKQAEKKARGQGPGRQTFIRTFYGRNSIVLDADANLDAVQEDRPHLIVEGDKERKHIDFSEAFINCLDARLKPEVIDLHSYAIMAVVLSEMCRFSNTDEQKAIMEMEHRNDFINSVVEIIDDYFCMIKEQH